VLGRADGLALAQEALGPGAVGEQQCADAERRRDAGNEAAEGLGRQGPHLGGNGVTAARGHAHQARALGRAARKRVEPVAALGLDGAKEGAAGNA
jgi:hypothetical protein